MTLKAFQISPRTSRRLLRAFWLAMLLGHAPALVDRMQQLASAGGLAGLVSLILVSLFFALKIVDVPWLRFAGGRRCWCALILAVALMHLNVLPVVGELSSGGQEHLIASQLLFVATLGSTQSALRRFIRWVGHLVAARPAVRPPRQDIAGWGQQARQRLARLTFGPPRAPPAR